MEVKILLALVFCCCVWLANGCVKTNACGDNSDCKNKRRRRFSDNHDNRPKGSVGKIGTHYSIKLQDHDPCDFNTYDNDLDGVIAKEEVQDILGINAETDALFADLDIMTEDSVIKLDEFYALAPLIITECYASDRK
ncbi:uncharacterized protein LOC123542753 [Mercenaria mercenaria]|uniref:uncharacterized protein LOC123542753 n=1 Tax=Mercenaria mercenaria TaxID=6596 RepID=UPI00234F4519|nr:uncharacterized protein LOC123542753 [Mercenaria mercenaria]